MDQTAGSNLVELSKLAVWCRHCNDFRNVVADSQSPNVLDCAVCSRRIGHLKWTPPAGRFKALIDRARTRDADRRG